MTFIAWWGAGLSTLLASIKAWEVWRDRFQLDVSYNFTGDENIGNEVLIRNRSSRPFILSHWELLYSSRHQLRRKFEPIEYREYDAGDTRVEPHTTHTLRFAEEKYFSWGHKALKGRQICIRLHIAGRKPVLRLVYPQ